MLIEPSAISGRMIRRRRILPGRRSTPADDPVPPAGIPEPSPKPDDE
jgi:hypothetical protein